MNGYPIIRNLLVLLGCISLLCCAMPTENAPYDANKARCLTYSHSIEINHQKRQIYFPDPVSQEIKYHRCMRK